MIGRPREFDRAEVLDRAMQLFWQQGYEATGMAALCGEMGLGRQSVYNCFGDKEKLFSEALEHYERTHLQPMLDQLRAPGSGLANVVAILNAWQDGAGSFDRGCLLTNSITELGRRDPELAALFERMMKRMEEGFREALARAVTDGELPVDRNPKELARLLTTLGQGLAAVGKIDPTGSFARDAIASLRKLITAQ